MDSRATRAIRRVVELDPGYRQAAADLISIEQAAGNGASAIRIARNLIAARQSAETHAALAQALAFDGLCEDALRHVDEAITRSPNGSWKATVDSSTALVACGRFQEAEREVVRFLAASGDRDPRSRLGANIRAYSLMALQGHCAEAARHAEASVSHALWYRGTRALLLSCGHDRLQAPRAREYVRSFRTAGGRENGATGAARFGEFETARSLAHALPPGSPSEIEYLAYVAHHEKRWEDAVGSFRRLLELVPSSSRLRVAGLLAETLLAAGRPADAITALADLDAALSVSTLDQQAHTWPRSMMVRARAREQVGDLPGASADVSRLLVVWSTADPDLPLLIEAKAMRERLAGVGLPR
jgi:tetratricopeptide (TPR) repeat protein